MSAPKPLTHDDIRTIVREELENLLVAPHQPRPILGRESKTKRLSRLLRKQLHLLEIQLDRLSVVVLEHHRNRRMKPNKRPRRSAHIVRNSNVKPQSVLSKTQQHRLMEVQKSLVVHNEGLSTVPNPVNKLSHETSPSADDLGGHSVGDQPVVEDTDASSTTGTPGGAA